MPFPIGTFIEYLFELLFSFVFKSSLRVSYSLLKILLADILDMQIVMNNKIRIVFIISSNLIDKIKFVQKIVTNLFFLKLKTKKNMLKLIKNQSKFAIR